MTKHSDPSVCGASGRESRRALPHGTARPGNRAFTICAARLLVRLTAVACPIRKLCGLPDGKPMLCCCDTWELTRTGCATPLRRWTRSLERCAYEAGQGTSIYGGGY